MRILVIASRKGGSGKTTLAGHLAVEAQRQGFGPVGLVDMDPQGSLADWWNAREAEEPYFVQTTIPSLAADLHSLEDQGMALVIVDTPPALTAALAQVMTFADFVVMPTRPSPHDLRSVGGTIDLAEDLAKPFALLVNGAAPRARITKEAVKLLSDQGPVVPTIVHHRVDFAVSMIDGRTVMELPGVSRSPLEIAAVWGYLGDRLHHVRQCRAWIGGASADRGATDGDVLWAAVGKGRYAS